MTRGCCVQTDRRTCDSVPATAAPAPAPKPDPAPSAPQRTAPPLPRQPHSGQTSTQAARVSVIPPSVPSRVLRVPRMRRRPKRRPTALAAESAMPRIMMPANASARSATHAPGGVAAALDSHTGAAMPAGAACQRVRGAIP